MEICKLTRERVREEVSRKQPGFYRLGYVIDGEFYTSYIGRSDTCLQTRLSQHVWKGLYPYFVARPTETKKEAYHQECLFYHLEKEDTANKNHPGSPDGSTLSCPYCEFEGFLSSAKEKDNKVYNNNVC